MKNLPDLTGAGFTIGIALLFSVSTLAQGVDLGCSPTVANPCGSRPNSSPAAIDYEGARLNDLTGRFNVVLQQLRAYHVPGIDDLYGMAAPSASA